MSRGDFSKLLEHCLEFIIICSCFQVLNKKISEASLGVRSNTSLLVLHDNDFLVTKNSSICFLNAVVSFFRFFKLNVAESTTLIISKGLQFKRDNLTISSKVRVNLFLGQGIGKVSYNNVALGVKLLIIFLMIKSDRLTIDLSVVHFSQASFRFFLRVESQETILQRFLSFVIALHHSFLELVTLGCENFVQLKIVEVRRQVANVKARVLIIAILLLSLVLTTSVVIIVSAALAILKSNGQTLGKLRLSCRHSLDLLVGLVHLLLHVRYLLLRHLLHSGHRHGHGLLGLLRIHSDYRKKFSKV